MDLKNSITQQESQSNFSVWEALNTLKGAINKKLLVPLSVLTLSTATPTFAQTTQGQKIEQVTPIGDPKADIDALMKKHKLTSLDDLSDKSAEDIFHIWDDLITLLWKNQKAQYHLDNTIVKFRDELRMYVDGYAWSSYDRSTYKTVISRWEKLAQSEEKLAKSKEDLAKSKEDLAKTTKKLEELKKIANMVWAATE